MGKHIGEEGADIRKFLPLIAWHFTEHIALSMYHFIVGQRQHIVFAVVIPHTKGDIVLMELAEPGIHAEIIQHIVHPAHVPFQVKA